ncbi:MAG: hypothetical protein FJ279_33610, partial [Planctomycetes bacterium]|nr:hypothetical protein [Planctomycetota bacterium]
MKLCAGSLALVFAGVLALTSFALAQERRSGMKHPVLAHAVDPKRAAEYERAVARVMAMSEDEMLAFVPPWAYVAYCECPNCYGGVEGNGVLVWSIEQPEQLKCRFCGTVVLPNEKYPEDRVLTGRNKLGDEIRFPYYHNEEKKVPHFLSTHLWRLKRAWLTAQCEALGRAYLATGKEDYARRVALALDRMAQRYPHYPVMQNLPRRFTFRESQDPPYLWDSGKWNYFHNEIPIEIIPAYDVVYDSPAFGELSRQRGYDVRAKIEKDFLKAAFAAAEVSKYHVSNVVGYDVRSAAILGWVIAEPRYVHWAFARMKENMDVGFFRDGMWHEAPSYHYMTIGGLKRCFDAIRGYSDPPGYVDAVDGTRFDNLEPEKQLPFWAKAQRAPEVIGFPNGI